MMDTSQTAGFGVRAVQWSRVTNATLFLRWLRDAIARTSPYTPTARGALSHPWAGQCSDTLDTLPVPIVVFQVVNPDRVSITTAFWGWFLATLVRRRRHRPSAPLEPGRRRTVTPLAHRLDTSRAPVFVCHT